MKALVASIALIGTCSSLTLHGQTVSTQLNGAGFNATMHSGGRIGSHPTTYVNGYRIPANSNTSPLFSSGLWFSGTTSNGVQRAYGHLYGSPQFFSTGPLTADGTAQTNASIALEYNRFWQTDASQLADNRAYFGCYYDPDCDLESNYPFGYDIPNSFFSWPAMGSVEDGQAPYLAPFYDRNGDGEYSASDGDQPCLPGDQSVYHIFNDRGSGQGGSGAMGLEVHMTAFCYFASNPNIHNTLFTHYRIINRSSTTYTNFRIGAFADFDLGCYSDDRISTDVGRSLLYVHNADANDETCSSPGYGAQPPAFGIQVLQGPLLDPDGLDNSNAPMIPAFNGSGFDDAISDNERYGLNGSMYYNGNSVPGTDDPSGSTEYYNYLQGLWANGMPLTYGGNGYGGSIPSAFAYPGNTDPTGVGTGGVPQAAWSDNTANDRKGIAIMGPITLGPGVEQEILLAYVYGRATSGGQQASVVALQNAADDVAALFASMPHIGISSAWCDPLSTGVPSNRKEMEPLVIHPNPAKDLIYVRTRGSMDRAELSILDARGNVVLTMPFRGELQTVGIDGLANGVYTLRLVAKDTVRVGRFIKH